MTETTNGQEEIGRDLIRAFALRSVGDVLPDRERVAEWLRGRGLGDVDLPLVVWFRDAVAGEVRSDARRALSLADLAAVLASLSRDPQARAIGPRTRALALHVLSRHGEAIEEYQAARRLYLEAGLPVEAARVGRAMIDAMMYQGLYEEALQAAAEARAVLVAHDEPVLVAQLDSNVGNIHHRLDRNLDALACYERAASVFAALAPHELAQVTCNRANVYCNLDDFRRAEQLYIEAEAAHRARGQEIGALQVRYSIGYLYFLRGSYHQAMRALHEIREEARTLGDTQTAALCVLDLAEIHLQMNALDEAAKLAAEARVLFGQLTMRYEAAKAAVFLGLAQLRLQETEASARSFAQARAELAAEGNEVYPALIDLYAAELELLRGEPGRAEELARRGETLFAAHGLKTKSGAAQLLRARARLGSGDAAGAEALSASVLRDCASLEVPWLNYQAHEVQGDALHKAGDREAAYEAYQRAVGEIERIRGTIRVDEFRSAFFRDKLRVYEKLIRLCLDGDEPERAFFYLESSKARTLVDLLMAELEVAPASGGATIDALQQQWRELREELHWFYSKAGQAGNGNQNRWLTIETDLRKEINQRECALGALARQLQAHDPQFEWLPPAAGITVSELRALLDEDETLIEYYFDHDRLRIFTIDRASDGNGLQVAVGGGTRGEIEEQILELRFHLDKFQYGAAYVGERMGRLRAGIDRCLRRLHAMLIAPVAARLRGKRLIIVPFGPLHNVPFQALTDGESSLLERYEVLHAPSAQLLKLCAGRATGRYDRALVLGAADEVAPQITDEIETIRRLFPQAHSFSGAGATARALAAHAPTSEIVHIASHAVFREDNPMFSALRLSDGWFTFYDISALRLPASLVTLSGCSTGAHQVYVGDELMGLARGFLSAGAASLLVSLWTVDDAVTAQLMTGFYTYLRAGARPGAALRAAALDLKAAYDHPYYWTPFILISRY